MVFAIVASILGVPLAGLLLLWIARAITIRHRRGGLRVVLLRGLASVLLCAWPALEIFTVLIVSALSFGSPRMVAAGKFYGMLAVPFIAGALIAVVVIIFFFAIAHYFRARAAQHLLVWTIQRAVQAAVPLSTALHALADDLYAGWSRRLRRVVRLLNLGNPLDMAIKRGWGKTTVDGELAIAVGTRYSNLAGTVKCIDPTDTSLDSAIEAMVRYLWYATALVGIACGSCTIVFPALADMLREFRRDLDIEFQQPLASPFADFFLQKSFFLKESSGMLLSIIMLAFVAVSICALLYYGGIVTGRGPFWAYWANSLDRARILDQIAQAIGQDRPAWECVRTLAEIYPKKLWRRRLSHVEEAMNKGVDLVHALYRGKVLTRSERNAFLNLEKRPTIAAHLRQHSVWLRHRFMARLTLFRQCLLTASVLVVGTVVGIEAMVLFDFLVWCDLVLAVAR